MKNKLKLDENYLNSYFQMLAKYGMWCPYDEMDGKRRLYTYYAMVLFCFAAIPPPFGEAMHAWFSRNDFVMFTQHFSMSAAMMSTVAKIVIIWRYRPDIEIAIDLLNWERRQPCNRKFALYRDEVIISTIKACRLFSLTFIVLVFWYCSFNYGKDLFYHKGNVEQLSISPLLILRSNKSSFYWIFFTIDKVTISYLAGCTACHDSIFIVFLMHIGAQLDLLKRRLETCQDKINYRFIDDNSIDNLKIVCVCRTNLQEFFLDPIDELHTCIEHHQKILRYACLVQNIFNITLLLQIGTSLLIIPMTGFQIFGERQLNKDELIDSINFVICALFQLFLYCWFGTDITAKSENICLSAYSSKWYIANSRFKESMKILLCRGQKPIVFRASYICELSSTTFMHVISKCFSSMALLQRINE